MSGAPGRLLLLSLRVGHFKGIRSFELDTGGGLDTEVHGHNDAGKTTTRDAFSWLLRGKDSSGRTDFSIKTIVDGEPMHGVDHEVEGTFRLPDESELTLRRVYKERWTKRRGSAKAVFNGHTTDYYVNDAPKKASEYNSIVDDLLPDETMMRILTIPEEFGEALDWKRRREILLEVCGDVSLEEIVDTDPAFHEIEGILGGRTLEDTQSVLAVQRRNVNKDLERIPDRIDEIQRQISGLGDGADESDVNAEIKAIDGRLSAARTKVVEIEQGGAVASKVKELRQLEGEALEAKNRATDSARERYEEAQQDVVKAREAVNRMKQAAQQSLDRTLALRRERDDLDNTLKATHEAFESVKALRWQDTAGECDVCGADPEHQKNLADEEEFNERRAQKLRKLRDQGMELREKLAGADRELESAAEHAESASNVVSSRKAELEEAELIAQQAADEAAAAREGVAEDDHFKSIVASIRTVEAQIATLRAEGAAAVVEAKQAVSALERQRESLQDTLGELRQRDKLTARLDELQGHERTLAEEYEEVERKIFLLERFIRAKVEMLEAQINARFDMADFKLFDVQINGGISECCEATYDGVPYADVNHASRINVGLDIIDTLCAHYGVAPPVWIDHAESIANVKETIGQQFRLRFVRDAPLSSSTIGGQDDGSE